MRQLWAPWRMTYISGDTAGEKGCIFCTKPSEPESNDEENLILLRGEKCFALMNLYPYNNGHLMVAPYVHHPGISQLSPDILQAMMVMAQRCIGALDGAMHPHGYNLGINQGAVAGAGIADHVHLHVVPRWNGDTNFMPVLADVKVMPEFLRTTWAQIRAQLAQMPSGS